MVAKYTITYNLMSFYGIFRPVVNKSLTERQVSEDVIHILISWLITF